jgi:hypothetical protein
MHRLIPHPDTPPKTIERVTAQLLASGPGEFWIEYSVAPSGSLLLPEGKDPMRTNELWKTTCFELFVRPAGSEGYVEFNFSPSSQWAAYEFSGYRAGMRDLPSNDPELWTSTPEGHFFLAVEALPKFPVAVVRIGLSAVIEETDGTKSYWALAHPPGAPDFHHEACFALGLPAARGA